MRSVLVIVILLLLAFVAYLAFAPAGRDFVPLGERRPSMEAEVAEAIGEHESYPFDFSLPSTEGQTVSLEDFAGRVLIVDIWGTWCPPCREEVPHFIELQNEYREEGLSIVGINYENGSSPEEAIEAIAEFTSDIPVNYPLLLGDDSTKQQIPGFQGYPTTLFIDRQGQVRLTLVGARPKADLEAVVKALLNPPVVDEQATEGE